MVRSLVDYTECPMTFPSTVDADESEVIDFSASCWHSDINV